MREWLPVRRPSLFDAVTEQNGATYIERSG